LPIYPLVGVAGSDRIGNDFNLGLRVTGGLTFGPKPGVVDIRVVLVFLVNPNPINYTYIPE